MANINSLFPTKYVKAADLQGQDLTLQIAGLSIEKMEDGSMEPVVKFANHNQGLVLNKTNALTIAEMYGEDYDRWGGRPITLYPTQCDFAGKRVDCIRIRPNMPQQGQGTLPPSQYPQQPYGQMPPAPQQQFPGYPSQPFGQQPPPPPAQYPQQQPPAYPGGYYQ